MERGRASESQREQVRAGERERRPFATHTKKTFVYLTMSLLLSLLRSVGVCRARFSRGVYVVKAQGFRHAYQHSVVPVSLLLLCMHDKAMALEKPTDAREPELHVVHFHGYLL